MTVHAITTEALVASYGAEPVLRHLDLQIPRGTVYGLLGPNGAGKTTLVRILATLLVPDAGTARILGWDVVVDRQQVRGTIGLTGQYASVDDLLTGEENLVQLARLHRLGRRAARERAADLLERFELSAAGRSRVSRYSGGMRRRLDLAASLITRPAVLFLDEPTTGLDPRSRRQMWATIAELSREGTTILLTTQYLDEADHLAHRIGVLDAGRLVIEGTAEELKRRVGRDLLTITVPPADADRAGAILGATVTRADRAAARVSAPLQGSQHLRAVLDRLAGEAITVTDVRISAPSLDDVFLALTDPNGRDRHAAASTEDVA